MSIVSDFKTVALKLALSAVFLIGPLSTPVTHASENVIRFGMSEGGYPPYQMTKSGELLGIIGDSFVEISRAIGFEAKIVVLPKKRVRYQIRKGQIDAISGALEWEGDTTGYVWTDGIVKVSDNLVMLQENRIDVPVAETLRGSSVALMRGYRYPSLEKLIANSTFNAIRAHKFKSLMRMVEIKRTNFGVLDRNVANWVIRNEELTFDPPLHFSSPGFDEVEFRIILFDEKWQPFVEAFNKKLSEFKANGRLQSIMDRYR